MSVRIGKVTLWGHDAPSVAGMVCQRLVVEQGKIVFGVWMSAALRTNKRRGEGVVFQRDPRYRSPLVNRKAGE